MAAQIFDGRGDYVLAIENNHPTLHKAISEYFDQVHEEEGCIESGVRLNHTSHATHSRRKNRYYYQAPIPESVKELTGIWLKGTRSIMQIRNITIRDGKEFCEIRYHLSSVPVGVKKFARELRALGHRKLASLVSGHDIQGRPKPDSQGTQSRKFCDASTLCKNILSLETSKESTRKKQKRGAERKTIS